MKQRFCLTMHFKAWHNLAMWSTFWLLGWTASKIVCSQPGCNLVDAGSLIRPVYKAPEFSRFIIYSHDVGHLVWWVSLCELPSRIKLPLFLGSLWTGLPVWIDIYRAKLLRLSFPLPQTAIDVVVINRRISGSLEKEMRSRQNYSTNQKLVFNSFARMND